MWVHVSLWHWRTTWWRNLFHPQRSLFVVTRRRRRRSNAPQETPAPHEMSKLVGRPVKSTSAAAAVANISGKEVEPSRTRKPQNQTSSTSSTSADELLSEVVDPKSLDFSPTQIEHWSFQFWKRKHGMRAHVRVQEPCQIQWEQSCVHIKTSNTHRGVKDVY